MIWYQIRYQLYQHDIRSYNIISDQTTWYMISNLYDIRSDLRISDQTTCYQIRSDNFRWQLDIRSDNMISDLTTWYQIWLYDIRSDYMLSDLTIWYQTRDNLISYQTTCYQIRSDFMISDHTTAGVPFSPLASSSTPGLIPCLGRLVFIDGVL